MFLIDEHGNKAEKMRLTLMKKVENARRVRMNWWQCPGGQSNEGQGAGRRKKLSAIL